MKKITCSSKISIGVDLLKGSRTTNLYTINLHDMASASPIFLMARATSTKSWLWNQRLSHLNFDTINDLARNNLVFGLPKFKYHKEHLCPSCEQGKNAKGHSHTQTSSIFKQRGYTSSYDLCGHEESAKHKWKAVFLLQALVIIVRTDNDTEFKNQVLQEYFNSVGISHRASSVRTPQHGAKAIATACYTQNRSIIHRRFNKTPYELINSRKPDISFLYVFEALCYPKNDREDIGKLGEKCDIGFFIGYSANSCAYRVYTQRIKKIMETMNLTFDEYQLGLDLPYAPSTITTQRPTKGELDLLFESMYDDHVGGQPHRPTPTNSSSLATSIPSTSQNVNDLDIQQQHGQPHPATIADNVPNAIFDDHTFVNPFATPSTSAAESYPLLGGTAKRKELILKNPSLRCFEWMHLDIFGHIAATNVTVFQINVKLHSCMSNYVLENPKKYGMESCDPVGNSMSSILDIVYATCFMRSVPSRPTRRPQGVKRFSDADYAGCKDTFKSTSGGAQFLGEKLVSWSSEA
ncbi:retrovirus-related pol polyprotein from transposon TNT 1-94 [Tanacetum coccineum]